MLIVLSVLWYTTSVYLFGISWSLYCLSSDIGLLFTSLVSLGHCSVCPLIYDFCLPLWYLLVIVLSVLWFMTSVYLFGISWSLNCLSSGLRLLFISWSLYCLSSGLRLLFTSLVSLGHCIACPLIYDFFLSLWYLLVIVLSVLWFMTSVYLLVIVLSVLWFMTSVYLLVIVLSVLWFMTSVYLLVIVLSVLWFMTSVYPLVIVLSCPLVYDFCLPLWYLLVIVLSVLWFTSSVYLFGISWSLYCLSSGLWLLFISWSLYCLSSGLWLLFIPWSLFCLVLWFTTSVYLFGISWSLYCLSSDLRVLFTSLVSLRHCIVCPLIYDFCLPLWYLLVIVLSVLWYTTSVYPVGISWSLYCLSSDVRLLFTSLVSLGHCIVCPLIYEFCLPLWYLLVIVLSVLWFMTSVYLFGISWSLYCLSSGLRLLYICLVSLGHCIVCPLIYDFCLPLWYLLVIVLSVLWFTTSVYLFGISWSLYCLSSDLRHLFTSLVSPGHCIVCPLIYDFCLPLWYLLVIVLSVLWYTTSVYLFCISRSLYCLSSDLRVLFTSSVSPGHCIVCPLIYDFCLPLWYLLVIVLPVLWFTTSVYLFGISWSLYCLSSDLRVLFTSLVSLCHCIFCPLVYLFGISWSLYCLSFDLRLLFTSLVSLGHCIVCPLIYDFCLPLWYLLVIVLSVLWFMTSVYLFGIYWSLYCLSSGLRLLFTSLVSLGHCIVCPLVYDFCLPLWYLLVIVLSVLWFMTSVYLFGISWSLNCLSSGLRLLFISWSLYCLSSGLRLLFTSLVYLAHCIICPLIYDFCLPLWYLLVIVLSVLWYRTSVYLFGISRSL